MVCYYTVCAFFRVARTSPRGPAVNKDVIGENRTDQVPMAHEKLRSLTIIMIFLQSVQQAITVTFWFENEVSYLNKTLTTGFKVNIATGKSFRTFKAPSCQGIRFSGVVGTFS